MKLNHPTGVEAENSALAFLVGQGLTLVERNWHCRYGELDLVMQHGAVYVFVEVKYRKNSQFGGAINSISSAKCAKLMRTAELYLQTKQIDVSCRIDGVFLQGDQEPIWLKNILG